MAQLATAAPVIHVAAVIKCEPGQVTPFAVQFTSADVQKHAYVLLVKGVPPGISLTEGFAVSAGIWLVDIAVASRLAINVPPGSEGRSDITVGVMDPDGRISNEVRTVLVIERAAAAAADAQPAAPLPPAPSPPPQAAAPKEPEPAPTTPADRELAARMVARGERELEQGNIAQARQFFLRAAQIGIARGALLLATTYDPRELARMRATSVQPNTAEARKWYDRARQLGAPEAAEQLSRLDGR